MHGHLNITFQSQVHNYVFKEPVILTSVATTLSASFNLPLCLNANTLHVWTTFFNVWTNSNDLRDIFLRNIGRYRSSQCRTL